MHFSSKVTYPHLLFVKWYFFQAAAAFALPALDRSGLAGKLHPAAAAAEPERPAFAVRRAVGPVSPQHCEIRPHPSGEIVRFPSRLQLPHSPRHCEHSDARRDIQSSAAPGAGVGCCPVGTIRTLPFVHHTGLITGPTVPTLNTSSVRPKPWIAPPVGAGLAQRAALTPWGLSSKRRNPHPSHSRIFFHRDPADHVSQPAQFLRLHAARHDDRLDKKPVLKNDVRRAGFRLPDG